MEYTIVRSELSQFIYDHPELTLSQKRAACNILLTGTHKMQILKYIETYKELDTIQQVFLDEIVRTLPPK